MLAAVNPAPKKRKKEVKTQRSKDIQHFKTKAFDACQLLVSAGAMSDPGDHEGLAAYIARAQELEESIDGAVSGEKRYVLAFPYTGTDVSHAGK